MKITLKWENETFTIEKRGENNDETQVMPVTVEVNFLFRLTICVKYREHSL